MHDRLYQKFVSYRKIFSDNYQSSDKWQAAKNLLARSNRFSDYQKNNKQSQTISKKS
jgi:hypothetical protein